MRSIYIAGQITGNPYYFEDFVYAEEALGLKGWKVWNPARLPAGLEKHKYLPVCMTMLQAADAICMLPGWKDSAGAVTERYFAAYQGKVIYEDVDLVPDLSHEDRPD